MPVEVLAHLRGWTIARGRVVDSRKGASMCRKTRAEEACALVERMLAHVVGVLRCGLSSHCSETNAVLGAARSLRACGWGKEDENTRMTCGATAHTWGRAPANLNFSGSVIHDTTITKPRQRKEMEAEENRADYRSP